MPVAVALLVHISVNRSGQVVVRPVLGGVSFHVWLRLLGAQSCVKSLICLLQVMICLSTIGFSLYIQLLIPSIIVHSQVTCVLWEVLLFPFHQ